MRTSPGVPPSETVASTGSVALASAALPPFPARESASLLRSARDRWRRSHSLLCHCTFGVKHPISAVSYGPFNAFILQIIRLGCSGSVSFWERRGERVGARNGLLLERCGLQLGRCALSFITCRKIDLGRASRWARNSACSPSASVRLLSRRRRSRPLCLWPQVSDPRLGVRAAAAFEAEALILRIRRPDETGVQARVLSGRPRSRRASPKFSRGSELWLAAVGLRDADSGRGRHHRLLPTSTSSRPITIPPYISVKMVGSQHQHASNRHAQSSSTQHEGHPCRSTTSDRPQSERRLDLALHSMTSMEPTMLIQHRYAPTYMAKCSSASCGTEGVAVIGSDCTS